MADMKIQYLPFGPINEPAWPDYFGHVVAEALGIPQREVTRQQRSFAKLATFGCRDFDDRVHQIRVVAQLSITRTLEEKGKQPLTTRYTCRFPDGICTPPREFMSLAILDGIASGRPYEIEPLDGDDEER